MKSKHLKKIIVVVFVFSIFSFLVATKVFAANNSNTNTNPIINISYNSIDDEYDNERNSGIQPRHVSNNSSGRQDTQATTWIGVVLLSVLFLIALKTLPNEIEKRL